MNATRVCLFLLWPLLLPCAAAMGSDVFWLVETNGVKQGPFRYLEGERIAVSGREFVLAKDLTRDQKIAERMKEVIVPEVEFRQADIRDVLDYLVRAASFPDREKNLNVMLPEAAGPVRELTFHGRYLSLYDLLTLVCKVSGYRWWVQEGVVRLEVEPPQRAGVGFMAETAVVRPDNAILKNLEAARKAMKELRTPAEDKAPATLEEAMAYLDRNLAMAKAPASCLEYEGIFFFSGGRSTAAVSDFSSGLAIKKGERTVFFWEKQESIPSDRNPFAAP